MQTAIEKGFRLTAETISVWIIDDDDFFRSTLMASLSLDSRMHCEHGFSTCEQAIELLQHDHPPEVLLVDIVLPGIDGVEGTKEIKSLSPSTNVMMLTNYADDEKIFRAICAGASGYLLKSATADEIIEGIEEVLNGGAPMNAQIARRVLDMFAAASKPKGAYGLTQREKQVLTLMVDGHTKKLLAEKLYLSFFTVETHIKNIYAKLQVHSRSGAVAKALKENLL